MFEVLRARLTEGKAAFLQHLLRCDVLRVCECLNVIIAEGLRGSRHCRHTREELRDQSSKCLCCVTFAAVVYWLVTYLGLRNAKERRAKKEDNFIPALTMYPMLGQWKLPMMPMIVGFSKVPSA